jgi:hypothetical protein
MGPTLPNTYQFPIQFEAVDTYTDDSESPNPEHDHSPSDARDMALLRQDNRGSARSSSPRPPDSLQTMPQMIAPPLPSSSTPPPVTSVVFPAVPVPSSNRSRVKKTKAGDSLANTPHNSSALSVSNYRTQLPSLMDTLLDRSVTMEQFSQQVDSYIKQLPGNLHKPLQKRAQSIGQALYKKPEPVQAYCYQAKTRVPRPLNPSVVLQDVVFRIPRSMSDAESSPQRDRWIEAKDKECNSFKERQTYKLPSIPISQIPKHLIIPSKIIFDIKKHPDCSFDKFKIRICARGDRWIDQLKQDTYAGNVRSESVKIIYSVDCCRT